MRSPAAYLGCVLGGSIPLHLRPGNDRVGRLELGPLPTRVRGSRVARERAVQAGVDLPRAGKPWPFAFGGWTPASESCPRRPRATGAGA